MFHVSVLYRIHPERIIYLYSDNASMIIHGMLPCVFASTLTNSGATQTASGSQKSKLLVLDGKKVGFRHFIYVTGKHTQDLPRALEPKCNYATYTFVMCIHLNSKHRNM